MKIAIVGAGKLGMKVIDNLLKGGNQVTVIDKDETKLSKLSSHMDVMTIVGNAKDVSFLKENGINDYDFLVATTDKDEKNMCIASFAKIIGCGRVIARVRDPEHMHQIDFIREHMNIDYIVNPDLLITNEIYKYLVEKNTLSNGVFTRNKVSLAEIPVNKLPGLIGKTLNSDLLPGMLVAAVERNGNVSIPDAEDVLMEDDVIFVVGKTNEIKSLARKTIDKNKYTDIQRVMIVGGGKTGFYLAQKLSERGDFVKIIERNKDRCYYLSSRLENVMVINGDATDMTLLEDENFEDMDAFVTATGFDEDNLLLALTAKNHGIIDVIAKVSRESYSQIITKMGVDVVLNPLNISANNISRYIQGTKQVISSTLVDGQAEIVEIAVSRKMPITKAPIKELGLPDQVLIMSINRGNEVIIPDGDTVIEDGDRVMIFSLLSKSADLEPFINKKQRMGLFKGE